MDALSGVRRVWSGARSVPERRSTPSTAPRLRAVGGRIGLVVPPQSAALTDVGAGVADDVDADDADRDA
ncbi:hypothetical protein [Streptomyces sp. NPDC056296]|uniref:hypothetical protein n=1 Tax=Streptomyces sp. NPDC056296 TaxID=3345775 RepID=UPI0035DF2686